MIQFDSDSAVMAHALELARQGFGAVEPNPLVGAVIVTPDRRLIAEGWHQVFGGPHAEIHAIQAAGERTRGADLFVTLEPCSHFGKTPPCTDAVIRAGFRRVVVGCEDPAPHVRGSGLRMLQESGVPVESGVCESDARRLIAPFRKLWLSGRPWVHAKWAMTLDGKIASKTGHSQWISCDASRQRVHQLRGCMDAIVTGAGTVRADNPLLTARPSGPRTAQRVIVDSSGASLTPDRQLILSRGESPVLVFVAASCPPAQVRRLTSLGCEVVVTSGEPRVSLSDVLNDLGRRRQTNVLVEAGPNLMGALFDQQLIDELHVFVAPKLVGGRDALSPVGGIGLERVPSTSGLIRVRWSQVGEDLLLQADVAGQGNS